MGWLYISSRPDPINLLANSMMHRPTGEYIVTRHLVKNLPGLYGASFFFNNTCNVFNVQNLRACVSCNLKGLLNYGTP
jgi:hypothetical protein